jgi:hypothetical protein
MKFFPNPEKAADKKLADATAERDAAIERLAVAQGAVSECAKALNQLAAQGADDATLDAGESKLDRAERRVLTLRPALADKETLLAALEAARSETLDKKARATTAAEIAALADELIEVAFAYDGSTAALAGVCNRALAVSTELNGMAVFATASRTEVAAAIPVLAEVLRQHGRQVLDGTAPATFPTPEAPFKPTIPEKPVVRRLFALRAVSWTNADGMLRAAQRYTDVDLSLECAARAITARVCVEMDDPVRRQNKGTWPGHPDPDQCFNLDGDVAEPQSNVLKHTGFVEIIGKPYNVRTAAGGVA